MDDPNLDGKKCMLYYCSQRDLLPYDCTKCRGLYCHDHIDNHECSLKQQDDNLGFPCPVCQKKVTYSGMQDPNEAFEAHAVSGECGNQPEKKPWKSGDPIGAEILPAKKKCPVCYDKLTPINKFTCNRCRQDVCMKHRLPESHKCR